MTNLKLLNLEDFGSQLFSYLLPFTYHSFKFWIFVNLFQFFLQIVAGLQGTKIIKGEGRARAGRAAWRVWISPVCVCTCVFKKFYGHGEIFSKIYLRNSDLSAPKRRWEHAECKKHSICIQYMTKYIRCYKHKYTDQSVDDYSQRNKIVREIYDTHTFCS